MIYPIGTQLVCKTTGKGYTVTFSNEIVTHYRVNDSKGECKTASIPELFEVTPRSLADTREAWGRTPENYAVFAPGGGGISSSAAHGGLGGGGSLSAMGTQPMPKVPFTIEEAMQQLLSESDFAAYKVCMALRHLLNESARDGKLTPQTVALLKAIK